MARALKVCSCIGNCAAHEGSCPELTTAGRCEACATAADRARGTAAERGYGSFWSRVIRPKYLKAHPICRLCPSVATVADHFPVSRRDLVAQGVKDPDGWHRMRPLCKACHDKHTAAEQAGGWNQR